MQVAVQEDYSLAFRIIKPGSNSYMMSKIPRKTYAFDPRIFFMKFPDQLPGVVSASVVDQDDFITKRRIPLLLAQIIQHSSQSFIKLGEVFCLIIEIGLTTENLIDIVSKFDKSIFIELGGNL